MGKKEHFILSGAVDERRQRCDLLGSACDQNCFPSHSVSWKRKGSDFSWQKIKGNPKCWSTGGVTSFAGGVNLFCPSWISWPGAWFESFWDILWHHFHPERVVSFKERAERGWKSGARSLSWKSGWNPCTLATSRRWNYPKTFFRFRERAIWKFP